MRFSVLLSRIHACVLCSICLCYCFGSTPSHTFEASRGIAECVPEMPMDLLTNNNNHHHNKIIWERSKTKYGKRMADATAKNSVLLYYYTEGIFWSHTNTNDVYTCAVHANTIGRGASCRLWIAGGANANIKRTFRAVAEHEKGNRKK